MVTHTDAESALVKPTIHRKTDDQTCDYSSVTGTMGGKIRVPWTFREKEKRKLLGTRVRARGY